MKIAWVTPFHIYSSIGRDSKIVCEEMAKSDEVDIWTVNRKDTLLSSVPVVFFEPGKTYPRKLGDYDHVIYNMGNFAGNHREIWQLMQQYPGVVLIHDQIMQNFFFQISMIPEFGGNRWTGEETFSKLMRTYYGVRGEAAAKAYFTSYYGDQLVRIWDSDTALAYPLFEPILTSAKAVFTHAAFFQNRLKNFFYGPTGYAYLPYFQKSSHVNSTLPTEFMGSGKALIVSTGIVHPVKRIDRVAEMLIENPDIAQKVQYVVIGDCGGPYGDYLQSLSEGQLRGCLYLLGYQPDEVMETFLRNADFCINLRYPNTEICSKSLIEQMAFGKPVIGIDSGVFGEIPDDCILKIDMGSEKIDLVAAFELLLDDKSKRLNIGKHAEKFVAENCSPKEYVTRFKTFLERIPPTIALDKVANDTIRLNRKALMDLSFDQLNLPWVVDATGRQISKACHSATTQSNKDKVLGVWLGFPYALDLHREGITKFLLYMLMAMLERYPVECELWTYSFNEEEVRTSFRSLLNDIELAKRVKVVTEKNFKEVLNVPVYKSKLPWTINESLDNLADAAKEFSRATSFITAIVYLDNVIGTGKSLFVPVHDLSIHTHYDDFVAKDPLYKARFIDIHSRTVNLARADAFMFSNSEFVRQEHLLKYIPSINEANTATVYLPVNIPKGINEHLLSEKTIRDKFRITKQYIFYPTQVRPYKNIKVLVEATSILHKRGYDINLVLTGNPSDVPDVEMAINQLKLKDVVMSISNVTEFELYSLYRYAILSAVPTLFEGGFPWQACEALFMDSPLVLSDIPVVRERIEITGMDPKNCGINLFDPSVPTELANAMEQVLLDRETAISSQMKFKEKLLSYSWFDAVEKYYNLFFAEQSLPCIKKEQMSK